MTTAEEKGHSQPRSLPTWRCNMDRQLDILRAVVVFFDKNNRSASYMEIAPLASVDATNVSGTLGFWKDIGILQSDGRKYQPSKDLTDTVRQLEWGDKDAAWRLFRQAIATAWFVLHLTMSFQIRKQMTPDELVSSLGNASGIPKKDKNTSVSLRNLVALLEMSGILLKDSSEIYTLNPELGAPEQKVLSVDEQKSLVQVRIGRELYAVEVDRLREFVKSSGKTLDSREHQLV